MKGLFLFPPNWCCSHPYMSIPCIMPYLKEDFDIKVVDLNIEYREYKRDEKFLLNCLEKIKKFISPELFVKYKLIYDFLIREKINCDNTIHSSEKFLQLEEYIFASAYETELEGFINVAYEKNGNLHSEINYYLPFYEEKFAKRVISECKEITGHRRIKKLELCSNKIE